MFCGKMSFRCSKTEGFTLLELITVLLLIAILGAIATPSFIRYYQGFCIKAVMMDIVQMVREGKMGGLGGKDYAVYFNSEEGTVTLISDRGADEKWNTADDVVVRTLRFSTKDGGLRFGYGSCGPLPKLAETKDGITFLNNIVVCNDRLTGNAGTVYIISLSGIAMAIKINSVDAGYTLWTSSGGGWLRL